MKKRNTDDDDRIIYLGKLSERMGEPYADLIFFRKSAALTEHELVFFEEIGNHADVYGECFETEFDSQYYRTPGKLFGETINACCLVRISISEIKALNIGAETLKILKEKDILYDLESLYHGGLWCKIVEIAKKYDDREDDEP